MDEASTMKMSGTRIVIEGPYDLLVGQYLRFKFKANNNQAEYEALNTDMSLSLEVCTSTPKAKKKDSYMVAK